MTKFNAKDAVEPFDYDFAPYVEAKDTVPEPSEDQVAKFYGDLGKQLENALGTERVAGVDLTEPRQVGKLFMSLTEDDHKAMYAQMLTLHADVCSGKPSVDDLSALPFRVRQAFYGALQGWLRPEASAPATKN